MWLVLMSAAMRVYITAETVQNISFSLILNSRFRTHKNLAAWDPLAILIAADQ